MKKLRATSNAKPFNENIASLERAIKAFLEKCGGFVYPLIILPRDSINEDVLFEIYTDLLKIGKREELNVLLYSYGGDAHTAFYIGRLLQSYSKHLRIFILREAKSAATLISCAADEIVFTEISELGPMDPQIPTDDASNRFSPLAIKHLFDLLEEESKKNHEHIVKSLTAKLPDPLILGEHLKTLETGKDYIFKLLLDRMMKGEEEKARGVSEKLVTGYPGHGYCIDLREAKNIGLKATQNDDDLNQELLSIMKAYKGVWSDWSTEMRQRKTSSIQTAARIHVELKFLARNIINHQIEGETTKRSETHSKTSATKHPRKTGKG